MLDKEKRIKELLDKVIVKGANPDNACIEYYVKSLIAIIVDLEDRVRLLDKIVSGIK
jgi:hypothetical protein